MFSAIQNKPSKELNELSSSYRLAIFKKIIRLGEYDIDRFLGKSHPYFFVTIFEEFIPGRDCNEKSLKIVSTMYLNKISSFFQ